MDTNIEEKFITKLIKDTKVGTVKWRTDSDYKIELPGYERYTSKIYTTDISDKVFRLYIYQFKNYTDEEEWDWIERVRFEMIDKEGDTLYEYIYNYSLYQLFNAVRKANSGVDDLMKDFLNK